jgi:hypothetical protein
MRLLLLVLVPLLLFGCGRGGTEVEGQGPVRSEVREVSDFKIIEAEGALVVEFSPGERQVEVYAQDNLLSYVETEVRDGALFIKTRDLLQSTELVRVVVSSPALRQIKLSGAVRAELSDLRGDLEAQFIGASRARLGGSLGLLSLTLDGTADVVLDDVRAEELVLESNGASNVIASGRAAKATVRTRDATSYRGEGMLIGAATVDASGSGSVAIHAEGSLTIKADGAVMVRHAGPAEPKVSSSGAVKIQRMAE